MQKKSYDNIDEPKWYFPSSLDEVSVLLEEGVATPCAGGTFLLRTGMKSITGLISLNCLPLNYFHSDGEHITIGATQTFSDVIENVRALFADDVLVKSLSCAASTPLRNIITIGGSIASFPMWSDLMGPLIALDAKVSTIGAQNGQHPITDYIRRKEIRRGTLITEVKFNRQNWRSYYYRATRTHFDYSAFNITILWKKTKTAVDDIRIVVVGVREKFKRLFDIENAMRGQKLCDIELSQLCDDVDLQFGQKKLGSSDFIQHLARVQLQRGLKKAIEE